MKWFAILNVNVRLAMIDYFGMNSFHLERIAAYGFVPIESNAQNEL